MTRKAPSGTRREGPELFGGQVDDESEVAVARGGDDDVDGPVRLEQLRPTESSSVTLTVAAACGDAQFLGTVRAPSPLRSATVTRQSSAASVCAVANRFPMHHL